VEIDELRDRQGNLRRLGTLEPPSGFVSSFPVWEDYFPLWEDDQIRDAVTDNNKLTGRALFQSRWIQEQNSHGSCNGYGLAGGLGRARYLRGYTDGLILSGSFPYSKMNNGRDAGSALEDGLKVVGQYGCPPESMCPWNMIYPSQQPRGIDAEAAKHKGLKAYAVKTKQGFRTALAAGFPVIVAVHAGGAFQRLNSKGIAGVDNGRGNHAVVCDGIEIIGGTEVYDMANSWGLSYGQNGRAYLTWDSFAGTFGAHCFYAVPTTEEKE
jgi:hypothetical protein